MVSHETLQLVNCFECLLSYTILHIEDFLIKQLNKLWKKTF